jgi:hypothetical protein
VGDTPRHADGTFASHSLEAVYAEIRRLDQLRAADQAAALTALTNQQHVNERQNEFRGALKDQAATLMPRAEAEGLIRDLRATVESLRQSQASNTTGDAVVAQAWKYLIAAGTLLLGIAGLIIAATR